jgi:hypothetical protein
MRATVSKAKRRRSANMLDKFRRAEAVKLGTDYCEMIRLSEN